MLEFSKANVILWDRNATVASKAHPLVSALLKREDVLACLPMRETSVRFASLVTTITPHARHVSATRPEHKEVIAMRREFAAAMSRETVLARQVAHIQDLT